MKNSKSQPNPRPAFLQGTGNSMALTIREFKAQIRNNIMKVVQSYTTYLPEKGWPISLAGGHSEPSQGFWVYLEPPWDHPRGYGLVSRGMGGKEKKLFWLLREF